MGGVFEYVDVASGRVLDVITVDGGLTLGGL